MEEATGRYRPSGRRVTFMAGFAVIAIAAFVLLWDVRFNHGDVAAAGDPVFTGITDATTRTAWTVLLIAIEAMALTGILLLLFIHRRDSAQGTEGWAADPEPAVAATSRIQIGCPGCGTVFEKASTDVDEPHEQEFRCPNCGRAGRLRTGLHKSVAIRDQVCGSCNRDFKAYRETSECPHCHAAQT